MEAVVQDLEKKWGEIQDNALSQPSPGILHHQTFFWHMMCLFECTTIAVSYLLRLYCFMHIIRLARITQECSDEN